MGAKIYGQHVRQGLLVEGVVAAHEATCRVAEEIRVVLALASEHQLLDRAGT